MIRRFSVALAAIALTATVATGCSTFSNNSNAAEAGGSELSIDDFETIIDDLATAQAASATTVAGDSTTTTSPDIPGEEARGILTRWISAKLLTSGLAKAGSPLDDAARATAESQWQDSAGEQWATLSDATKDFLVDERAGTNTLVDGTYITDAQVKGAYEAGLAASQTLCLRFIGFTDADTADDVYQQLLDGGDFAELADANNPDPSTSNGGIFVNSDTNSECSAAGQLQATVAQSLAQTAIGQPSTPITLSGSDGSSQYYIFLQRPYDEVATAAAPLVRQSLAPAIERDLLAGSSVHVDSRYGTWDADELTVTPAD